MERRAYGPHTYQWISFKGLLVFVGDEWKGNLAKQNVLVAFLLTVIYCISWVFDEVHNEKDAQVYYAKYLSL